MTAGHRPAPIDVTDAPALTKRSGRIFARSAASGFRASGDLLEIFDEIGPDGVSTSTVANYLKGASGDITLKINSPGGSVDHGIGIYNQLVAYPGTVSVEVIGVAASAASLVAMAGDSIAIASNGFLMLHQVWGLTVGNAGDHNKAADTLARFDQSLAKTYARRTGETVATIAKMMATETWLDGPEAVRLGFADSILGKPAAAAAFDLSIYANAPASLKRSASDAKTQPQLIESRVHLERELRDKLGLAHGAARKIASAGFAALAGEPQTEIDELAVRIAQACAELTRI